jgi:predicted helicase
MTTIHELLAEYAALSPDTKTKGLLFERLVQKFLQTDPLHAATYDEVWLWNEWPGRAGKADTGIDLVARERYTGHLCAIQCKFYDPAHSLQKSDIDSFFTASGKIGFTSRIVVSTTDKWSQHATEALNDQQITTIRMGVDDLENSEIDWSKYSFSNPDSIALVSRKKLRPHQSEALNDVINGFDEGDRGKLIMACGTGKTFTSLRIAETLVQPGGSVLFLVPSIALLSQSLKEWAAQSAHQIRAFAVCSDTKVGKNLEDYSVNDLAFPATTKSPQLIAAVNAGSNPEGLTVYFSTYQSIQVINEAQVAGLPEFDLIICDEAHRTTGVKLAESDESNFVKVHDADYIRAERRLYMTATPKIYGEAVKTKAKDASAELTSMDDVSKFGPEFHRLGFGEAVERDLLSDYRVLVLAISTDAVSSEFQQQFQLNGELKIDDTARITGIYNALAKRGVEGLGDDKADLAPMRRAVAFSRSIKDSQKVAGLLNANGSVPELLTDVWNPLVLEAQHVDGTMNVLERNTRLDWLKAESEGNATRILTNARCLSEGVDVPALDAVIFLNPRDSQVDVVQSVGRVMRKAEGKQYGYIILPIAVPAGVEPAQALNDNANFKVVWDVLRALRAHDERFQAKIESIDLNKGKPDDQIQVISEPGFRSSDSDAPGDGQPTQTPLDLSALDWREAVYAKIVEKVGERQYWENWASNVADVASKQTARIGLLLDSSPEVRDEFDRFVKGLQDNLNPSVTEQDALDMLAQHLITQPVLDALFEDFSFAAHNPVAQAMQGMLAVLQGANLEAETEGLEAFYDSVRKNVKQITDAGGKQTFLKMLYQRFFAVALKKASERLGIVYTPNEIVDFILHSVEHVLRTEFDSSIAAKGVHVLDPFTGTGTFLTRLMQLDLIPDADLPRKYREELHANEINLLAYYVAAVNIEEVYHSRMGGNYVPFTNILLTDTFQMTEADDELDAGGIFEANNQGVINQLAQHIQVVIGNPPYSKGQADANDENANVKYVSLDTSISNSYIARSSARLTTSLYDSYVRAIRWATDHTANQGVIAYVINGGFIEGNAASGLRRSLMDDFASVYVLNLRGNTLTAGEHARKEGGQIFGSGSRATIAILLLVKDGARRADEVSYYEVEDYLSRAEKLDLLHQFVRSANVPWRDIRPNESADWRNPRNPEFQGFGPLAANESSSGEHSIFRLRSSGLKSNRDSWVYNSSALSVEHSVKQTIETYHSDLERSKDIPAHSLHRTRDSRLISWDGTLEARFARRAQLSYDPKAILEGVYRPFQKQTVYFDRQLNNSVYRLPELFPTQQGNLGIYVNGFHASSAPACLMVDLLPNLDLFGKGGQLLPRFSFKVSPPDPNQLLPVDIATERIDNITDEILADYRKSFGAEVSKDDIFYYVYGILHSPEYREKYAADLKKMLPRIPKAKAFKEFAGAGKELADLHINYETVEQYPLEEIATGSNLLVTKMRFAGKRPNVDKSRIVYNEDVTLAGIPDEAHEYLLGSRSAIEWILERYQVKKDKASGIVNDANDWGLEHGNPRYILDLLKSIVTVSVETVRIVKALPTLDVID